jgi:hypothetical protein
MKKQLLTLASVLLAGATALMAQPASWTDCASGTSVTRNWTGLGADNDWNTPRKLVR